MTYAPSNLYEQAADSVWHSLNGTLEDLRRVDPAGVHERSGDANRQGLPRVIEVIVNVLEWYETHGPPREAFLLSTPYGSTYVSDERVRLAADVMNARRILWFRKGAGISAELVDEEIAHV